jgi:hypothetical protein
MGLPRQDKDQADDENDPAENHQHAAEVAHTASLVHQRACFVPDGPLGFDGRSRRIMA